MKDHYVALGKVHHKQHAPIEQEQSYPYVILGLYQNHPLPSLAPLFGSKLALCHVEATEVHKIAQKHGVQETFDIITLTAPKILGCSYNPATLYLMMRDGHIPYCLVEVASKGKRHHYFLENHAKHPGEFSSEHKKEFFLSPFNDLEGIYRFRVLLHEKRIYFEMVLMQENKEAVTAFFQGHLEPLTRLNLLKALIQSRFAPFRLSWLGKNHKP